MIETTLLSAIGDYGIQAVMLIWFMFRTEKALKNNTEAMNKVNLAIIDCKYNKKK